VTLRRQWIDRLQPQCLKGILPPRVRVRSTESKEEFILESSNPSDLCEVVSKIKGRVIDQLVSPGSRIRIQSNGIDESIDSDVDMNEEMDKEHSKKDMKTPDVEDERRGHSRPGAADDDSRKPVGQNDRRKALQKKREKKDLQPEQHHSPSPNRVTHQRQNATDDSEAVGNDSHNVSASVNHSDSASESAQESVCDAQASATGDSGKFANDSEETRQKETKKKDLQPGQPDGDDSLHGTVSVREDDAQYGEQAVPKDREQRENHHMPTGSVTERSKQVQDNAGESNASPNDKVSAASSHRQERRYQIDEPLWAYIQFINPHKWDKKLTASQHAKQGNDTVELTGSSTDIDEFKTFCDMNRLSRAVMKKLQRMPDKCTAEVFRRRVLELSDPKILVRSTADDPHFCELVGKRSDIDKLEKTISSRYPELVETKQIHPQPTESTGQTSYAASATSSSAAASTFSYAAAAASENYLSRGDDQMPARMREHPSEAGLDFQTALARLSVRIVTGDLLKWRCEVLVDSCDSRLTHLGGISLLFAKAAGRKMQQECDAYKRQRGALPTCGVMDTTAGNIQPPVRRLIHACSPNGHLCRNWNELGPMLEQTFLKCLMCANDKLQARSIALPAISSGASSLT